MPNVAALISRQIDNNPITQLLLKQGNTIIEPPDGFVFIADENQKLLRDERGAYLLDHEED
jgi:hypothetical protein